MDLLIDRSYCAFHKMQREESEKKIIKDYKISIQEKTSEKVCGISMRFGRFLDVCN